MRALTMVLLFCTLAAVNLTSLAEDVVIKNARIVTGDAAANRETADIWVQKGIIKAIGENIAVPEGAQLIDATGKIVAPGFFNAQTWMGLEEISALDETKDYATEHERVTASLRVSDAINAHSTLIPHNRSLGLTHSLVQPESKHSLFAGIAAVIKLTGHDTVVSDDAAMVVILGERGKASAGGSRAAAIALLREAIEDARDYRANRDSYNRGNRRDYPLSRHDLEALIPVIERRMPLLVQVDRASDIERVLRFAKDQRLRLILSGVTEGWRVADQIAAQKVPVIIDPIENLPSSYEKLGSRLDNARILHEAGVTLLFTGMGWQVTHNAYLVRQSAGNAVANGLPYDVAISSITRNPAQVFGLKGYGTIEVGAKASLIVWSGDPLEMTSAVEHVLIDGRSYPLVSRATRLRDRYFEMYRDSGSVE